MDEIKGEVLSIREEQRGIYTVITSESWEDLKNRDTVYRPAFGCPQYIKEINRKHLDEIKKFYPGIETSGYV